MEQPLVSVIVVSYNHANYINEVLTSIVSQTYQNWELIVADDASTDESVLEFEKFLLENKVAAKKIFHQKNTGLSTVLNEAIEISSGEFVKIIAADDFLHPEYLEKSVKYLSQKGETYGMVFTDTFSVNEDGNTVPDISDYNKLGNIPAEEFQKELIKGNRIAALTVLMRTAALKETGKYDSKFIVEDYYRWLKINEKYLIAYIPEKLAYYRFHDENISKIKADRIEDETLLLQMKFDKRGIVKSIINDKMYSRYFSKQKNSKEIITAFSHYSSHNKRLLFCIKYNLPCSFYRLISKFV